ncbi:MAG: PIG-L deacetylase family protein [Ilumatobacteraceae bacterium]
MSTSEPGQPPADPMAGGTERWSRDLPPPSSALAIGAHPDDVEFGAGGTLAKWAAAGCEIHHLVCTDGSKGTWDVAADLEVLIRRRQDEQRAAARSLAGDRAGTVRFLGITDGELESVLGLRSAVARAIREVRPEVVLGHDPWKRYRLHPDHRAAGFLTIDAVVAARDPHFYPEHELEHHRPRAILLWEADLANHVEDVTDHVPTKLAALHAHESQFESTMKAAGPDDLAAFDERITGRLAALGTPHGLAAAELFHLIDDV